MADETTVLNAKVVVDASQARQAQSEFDNAVNGMAQSARAKFQDIKAQTDSLIAKNNEQAINRRNIVNQIKQLDDQMAKSAVSLSQAVRSAFVEMATAAAVIIGPTMAVVAVLKELQKAAEFRGMAIAAKNMSATYGIDMQRIIAAMREASEGTLTTTQSFELFNRALMANAEVVEALPRLIEISHAASIATGKDTTMVMSAMLEGISRAQTRGISQAGIYLRLADVVDEYAKAHGVATEQIDLHTRQLLVLNEVLGKGDALINAVGKETDKEADTFERLWASTKGLLTTMEQFPIVTETVVESLITAVKAATQLVSIMGGAVVGGMELAKLAAQMKVGINIAGVGIGAGSKGWEDVVGGANKAFEDTFKRMTTAQGIIYGGGEDDARERARRRIATQARDFANEETEAEADRVEKAQKYYDKHNEIIISAGQKAYDAERGMLQDIQELNIDHWQKLQDITLEGARKREEIQIDYSRKVEDAELDYQQAVEDAGRESARRRVEIEQRYQERLIQIQRRFEDEYWSAVKNRDAIALVEAVRNRNRGIQDATRQRDQDMANEDANEDEKRQQALIAYQRKLADAQRYYQRQMQDQRTSEQRAIEDENMHYAYRETEIRRHYQWRLEEIRRALAQELADANAQYTQSEADYSAHLARMAAIAQAYMSQLYGYSGGGTPYERPSGGEVYRQHGGIDLVNSPTRIVAGEGGPELVLTMPLGGQRALSVPSMSHLVSGNVSHQVDMVTARGMRGMEARIVAAVMQAMKQVVR